MSLAERYELQELLGRGGMGEVWRALDVHLGRQVAIKVLLANWSGENRDEAVARFRREGKAAARLSHPAVAGVYDVGEHDGQVFLVLELLDGSDLKSALDERADGLPVEDVLDYGVQVADALAAAHRAGVVHRDVKPANLMLLTSGRVKICDFGIARLEGSTVALSAVGTRIGTLAYMPPEQLQGLPIDGAADVYALGATLFHLLTGRLVFPAEDLRTMIAQHLMSPPPRASALRPGVPADLDDYLGRMLSKEASLRPAAESVPGALAAIRERLVRAGSRDLAAEAETHARAVADPGMRALALAHVGRALADRDPRRAVEVLREAERLARWGPPRDPGTPGPEDVRQWALAALAPAMAEHDPVEAERIARSITRPESRMLGFLGVANVLANRAPQRALTLLAQAGGIVYSVAAVGNRPDALVESARVMLRVDAPQGRRMLAEAEAAARAEEPVDEETLARIVTLCGAHDPLSAEYLARSIRDQGRRAVALAAVARALHQSAPERAAERAREAEGICRSGDPETAVLLVVAHLLAGVAPEMSGPMLEAAVGQVLGGAEFDGLWVLLLARVAAGFAPRRSLGLVDEVLRRGGGPLDGHAELAVAEVLSVLARGPATGEDWFHTMESWWMDH